MSRLRQEIEKRLVIVEEVLDSLDGMSFNLFLGPVLDHEYIHSHPRFLGSIDSGALVLTTRRLVAIWWVTGDEVGLFYARAVHGVIEQPPSRVTFLVDGGVALEARLKRSSKSRRRHLSSLAASSMMTLQATTGDASTQLAASYAEEQAEKQAAEQRQWEEEERELEEQRRREEEDLLLG